MSIISIAVPVSDRWYFTELLRGLKQKVTDSGLQARVHLIPSSETASADAAAAILQDFADGESLGAIAAGFRYRAEVGNQALTWKRPLVTIGGSVLGFPTVMIDDVSAARIATGHLIDLGHTRIAHFTATKELQADYLTLSRRTKGYRSAMESAGLDPVVTEHGFDQASAYRAAHELLARRSRPTGIFATSDDIAIAVLTAARDLDLRPGYDVSIIGINDQPQAAEQDLTTIRQQPAELGEIAVEMLMTGLESGPDPKHSRLHPFTLVKRGSTGTARNA